MTEQTENLVLELLRAVRADIGNIKHDIRDIKGQLISLRHHQTAADTDLLRNDETIAHLQQRMERIEVRLEIGGEA